MASLVRISPFDRSAFPPPPNNIHLMWQLGGNELEFRLVFELRELWLSTLSWLILRSRCEMNKFIKFATACRTGSNPELNMSRYKRQSSPRARIRDSWFQGSSNEHAWPPHFKTFWEQSGSCFVHSETWYFRCEYVLLYNRSVGNSDAGVAILA